jgi:N,N'-diacetyllegionaminate synthase
MTMSILKPKIIAEIGNSHEGSLGIALSMIDMAAKSGADIVKFQIHFSEFESTKYEPFRTSNFKQDKTRSDYWTRVNFSANEWYKIVEYCETKKIEFMCSPFSTEAAHFLFKNGLVKRWKIGSGEISNLPLLEFVFGTNFEVLLSTGLTDEKLLGKVISFIDQRFNLDKLILMHCVSQYPTNLSHTAMSLINEYSEKYKVRVGHSDHSGIVSTSLFALTLPIEFLEVHLTPNNLFFGPDTSSSLTPEELAFVVNFRNDLHEIKKSYFTRDQLFEMSRQTAEIFRKSLYWAANFDQGDTVKQSSFVVRKPWKGIDAFEANSIVGRTLTRKVIKGDPIQESDIE